ALRRRDCGGNRAASGFRAGRGRWRARPGSGASRARTGRSPRDGCVLAGRDSSPARRSAVTPPLERVDGRRGRCGSPLRFSPKRGGRARQTMAASMRLPKTAHRSRPWRIHELTTDFRLEDVWALPTTGGADDFHRLVRLIASGDPARRSPASVRTLWAIRWKVGALFGWDSPTASSGSLTLRDRLPADLRTLRSGPDFAALPFTSVYVLEDEWAAEIANRTMRGVLHVGWVPDGTGGYYGQLVVYVRQ